MKPRGEFFDIERDENKQRNVAAFSDLDTTARDAFVTESLERCEEIGIHVDGCVFVADLLRGAYYRGFCAGVETMSKRVQGDQDERTARHG